MANGGAGARGRAVLLSKCVAGAFLSEHVPRIAAAHEEVIVAIDEGNEEGTLAPLPERWADARARLAGLEHVWTTPLVHTLSLPRPVDRCAALAARLGRFDALYTDSSVYHAHATQLGLRCVRLPEASASQLPARANDVSRALVVTRAQPFHRGHLALVQHALSLAHEVLLVVAGAERSYAARDPFSAGERLAFVRAGLGALAERVWLIALPSPFWPAAALTELCFTCPRYELVVAHNPLLRALATQQGTPVAALAEPFAVDGQPVSATRVRERLRREGAGAWLNELIPDAVAELFINLPGLGERCAIVAAGA